jgi:hypothetical protein
MSIGDDLTQGTKVISHAHHPATVVANTDVTLLEDAKPDVELQNEGLTVVEELGLQCEPHLTSCLCRFSNDFMGFRGEGDKDPHHHDGVQPSPIDGRGRAHHL